jgi:hypothetical protein
VEFMNTEFNQCNAIAIVNTDSQSQLKQLLTT